MRRRMAGLLLLLAVLTTGCWDRLEVNDLAIVDLVAIDTADEGVRLTVSVVVPSRAQSPASAGGAGGGGGAVSGRPTSAFSASGKTIMDASMKIQKRLSRRIFWAHTRILVIGEEFARAGVRPALDFWSRHREPRPLMQIAVTPGRAADFIMAQPRLERLLSESVRETINMGMQARVTIKDFFEWIRSETEEPIAPRVELVAGEQGEDSQVSGTAVFKDDRLVGWLSDAETRGLLWLRGEVKTGVATVDVPSGGRISMMLIRGSTNISPDFSTGRLRIHVSIVAEDDVYESSAPIDLGKDEVVSVVQQLLRQAIEDRVRQTLAKVQHQLQADVLKFGEAVHRSAPLAWEGGLKQRWPEVFPEVPVDIAVTAHVRRTGEHGAPLGTETDQLRSNPQQLKKPKG